MRKQAGESGRVWGNTPTRLRPVYSSDSVMAIQPTNKQDEETGLRHDLSHFVPAALEQQNGQETDEGET